MGRGVDIDPVAKQTSTCRHRPPRGAAAGANRMARRSIATVALSGSLDEKLRAIAGAGFDAVEIFWNDLLTFNGSPRDAGQLRRGRGLSICAVHPFPDSAALPTAPACPHFAR